MNLQNNIQTLRAEVPLSTQIIAVSKSVGIESIAEAYSFGIKHFAENKAQDLVNKAQYFIHYPDIVWHFIGHLQKNKVRKVVQIVDRIHSIDSIELLSRVSQIAISEKKKINICLQVKLLPDPTKSGLSQTELLSNISFWESMQSSEYINIDGLMTILPLECELPGDVFSQMRILQQKINTLSSTLNIKELSMGMSQDYKEAIQHGSTMIRIGRQLFD